MHYYLQDKAEDTALSLPNITDPANDDKWLNMPRQIYAN